MDPGAAWLKRKQVKLKTINHKGMTLLEVVVATTLGVILILASYRLYSGISQQTMQTASGIISIERVRIVEDQTKFFLNHSGLGVPFDAPVIVSAEKNQLALMVNSGFFTYAAGDIYLAAFSEVDVPVHSTAGLSLALDNASSNGLPVILLSDDGVPLFSNSKSGDALLIKKVDEEEIEEDSITMICGGDPLWIREGQYIGEQAKLHSFTIENGSLVLSTLDVGGFEEKIPIAGNVEAFDAGFFYRPTYFEPYQEPVWSYDASEEDDGCMYRPGDFDEPGTFCEPGCDPKVDPDCAGCIPCSGTINRILDTDFSGQITIEDDTDGDGLIDGADLNEVADFKQSNLMRLWVLVAGDKVFASKGKSTYVVGRRVLKYSDGRQRALKVIDVEIKNIK